VSERAPCERCASPLEAGDLRCAICGQAAPLPATGGAAARRSELEVRVMRCDECSAAVRYDAAAQGLACAFCGAVMRVETVSDPQEQTEHFLAFSVRREDAGAALRGWLGGRGFFRPSDLGSASRVERVRALWWVGWSFDAEALVSWTADSDAGAGRSAWAPHAGRAHLRFDDVVVSASRGLSQAETDALGPRYDLAARGPAPSATAPGAGADGAAETDVVVEQFDVQRSLARRRVLEVLRESAARAVEAHHVPGRTKRNVHAEPLLRSLATTRYAFPAWVLTYRYRGEVHRAVVCGQDATCVVGSAPYSVAKIALAVAAVLLVIGAVVAALVLG